MQPLLLLERLFLAGLQTLGGGNQRRTDLLLRCETEPERAVRDLGVAIDALAAEEEIGAALIAATERLKAGEEQAFEEQQRLHSAREEIRERLASLVGTD